ARLAESGVEDKIRRSIGKTGKLGVFVFLPESCFAKDRGFHDTAILKLFRCVPLIVRKSWPEIDSRQRTRGHRANAISGVKTLAFDGSDCHSTLWFGLLDRSNMP